MLCLSIASFTGHVHLAGSFAWIGTPSALVAFSVATVLEIAAYYIPYLDNMLDSIAVPTATVAGILITASMVTDMDPFLRWTLAVIAGGGAAMTTQLATTKLRLASTATTGGIGNHLLSTGEVIMASLLSALAIVWPLFTIFLVIALLTVCWLLIYFVGKRVWRLFKGQTAMVNSRG